MASLRVTNLAINNCLVSKERGLLTPLKAPEGDHFEQVEAEFQVPGLTELI